MVIEISSCWQGWGHWGITGTREHSRGEENVLTLDCGVVIWIYTHVKHCILLCINYALIEKFKSLYLMLDSLVLGFRTSVHLLIFYDYFKSRITLSIEQ